MILCCLLDLSGHFPDECMYRVVRDLTPHVGYSDRGGSALLHLYKVILEYIFFIDQIRTCPRFFFQSRDYVKGLETWLSICDSGLKLLTSASLSKAGLFWSDWKAACWWYINPIALGKFWEAISTLVFFPSVKWSRGASLINFSSFLLCVFINYLLQNQAQWCLQRK